MTDISPSEVITTPLLRPLHTFPISVLIVDDQEIIVETVREMLSEEKDIAFHFCIKPLEALEVAMKVKPTVILQDLIMPEINGLELTKYFRANQKTSDIPLIVLSAKEDPALKAEAFSVGANDYIVKLPDKRELIARIRYHSNAYIRLLERNEAYEKLNESQRLLNNELAEAAEYVRSLLPSPLKGSLEANWEFIPSQQLGGDALGYHWLDNEHFAIYLLDVCGHGIGAALLSISVMNVLRSQSLANTHFNDPVEVLTALNATFQMENQNNMFFSIWYGVWNPSTRNLTYASGGHPPALLLAPWHPPQLLKTDGLVIGAATDVEFASSSCHISEGSQLYIFSDGVYEIIKPDGSMLYLKDLVQIICAASSKPESTLEQVRQKIQSCSGKAEVNDDYSLLQVIF